MADSVTDRYRKSERQRLGGIPALKSAMEGQMQGSSPLLGQQAMSMLATAARQNQIDKPVAVDQSTAQAKWEQSLPPFTGLRNEQALPPFEQPGGSLPMDGYMAAQGTQPAAAPPPTPQMTAPPVQQPAIMPMTTEPVPQNLGDPAIAALVQAMQQKKMSPWAVNEGNFMDQYGG